MDYSGTALLSHFNSPNNLALKSQPRARRTIREGTYATWLAHVMHSEEGYYKTDPLKINSDITNA